MAAFVTNAVRYRLAITTQLQYNTSIVEFIRFDDKKQPKYKNNKLHINNIKISQVW